MYFPFLTSEAKCGEAALNVADRQNAYSTTLAVGAIVELFRLVKRETELNREILSFLISHDDRPVRIYSYYPVISGNKTTFYRRKIRVFDFQALEGKEKWTTNIFTQNVYNLWMPKHLDRIRSIVDEIPLPPDFTLPPSSRDIWTFARLRGSLSHSDMSTGHDGVCQGGQTKLLLVLLAWVHDAHGLAVGKFYARATKMLIAITVGKRALVELFKMHFSKSQNDVVYVASKHGCKSG